MEQIEQQISNPGALIHNPKLRGEWAELRFMARAAEHGLMVSRPWGDSAPYDVMVERDGRIHRVQIKSTMQKVRNSYACHMPVPRKSGKPECGAGAAAREKSANPCQPDGAPFAPRPALSEVEGDLTTPRPHDAANKTNPIDFVAAYIIPLDLWYILPAVIAARLRGYIYLSPRQPSHKYADYQEAWHLLLGSGPYPDHAEVVSGSTAPSSR